MVPDIADEVHEQPHRVVHLDRRAVWGVRTDEVDFDSGTVKRDLMLHPGAVGIIAVDDEDRVLLIRQYRHPVGMYLWEPPAGLLDVDGEPAFMTAQRELAEEAGLEAQQWNVLVDYFLSPGGSTEAFRFFVARGLSELADGRVHTGEAEEADLPQAWVPLAEAVDLVFSGRVHNPATVMGLLAASAASARGWADLKPMDEPWPVRDHLLETGRVFQR